jgi:hypothetical protein
MDENMERNGVSRRTVLRRAGVVGAVAWSAPVLSSLATPAFAGTPEDCVWRCGEDITPFACGDNCFRTVTTEGDCFCWQDFSCTGTTCTSSATCPPGYRCEPNGCCGGECAPPCGTTQAVEAGAKSNARG